MSATSDRNLLVGILALQMDFIDRDQLVTAMHGWVLEKERFIEDILLEQRALTDETRDLLVALVEKHLELHDQDAEKSLQAVSSFGPSQTTLQAIDDSELEASLKQVSVSRDNEDEFATQTFTVPTGTGGRFRVLRLHAKGGLGAVYVARDEELNREVAVKEIRQELADDSDSRGRFLVEAEITGGLEHPGIVPVYGLGQYDDGRPFYAMRFIRGESLRDAIAGYHHRARDRENDTTRRLRFRDLLGRFIDVCHAIEYAHRRGVLHRDLKPGNIMLGKYGETLIVDWGLAKTMDGSLPEESDEPPLRAMSSSGSTVTRMGSRVGTPAYMSPEQAAGRLDLLNATSDVYCLGATLYALLTGEPPVSDRRPEALAQKIERGEFPKPRERNSQVHPALEATCLKAMAREQSDRYQSASALAADIERWLADEPVTAWSEPYSIRVGRWLRRHRILVNNVLVGLFVALLALSMAVIMVSNAYQRETAAHDHAAQNLALAREAVDTMLTQVGEETLADIPQMETIRRRLLLQANELYRRLSERKPDNPDLRLDAALAWHRVGDINRILQNKEKSVQAYEEAIRRLTALRDEYPGEPSYQQELANAYNWLGVILKKDDLESAKNAYQQAIQLQEVLVDRDGNEPDYKHQLARSLYNRAIVYTESRNLEEAETEYHRAIDLLRGLSKTHPDGKNTLAYEQERARCQNNLGNLVMNEDPTKAIDRFDAAIELMHDVTSQAPGNRKYKWELATYYNNRANVQRKSDLESAEESNSEAIALFEELAQPIPAIRNELGNSLQSRGLILVAAGRSSDATTFFQRAHAEFTGLVERFPTDPEYRDRLGNALHELGKLRFIGSAYPDAAKLAKEAVDQHRKALEKRPRNQSYGEHLANDFYLGAWCLAKLEDYEGAAEFARECVVHGSTERGQTIMKDVQVWIKQIRENTDLNSDEKTRFVQLFENIVDR